MENKIYTEKRVNYDKLHSKLPIFRVKSVKIYTGQFFLTQAPPVVPVTNMRYAWTHLVADHFLPADLQEESDFCPFV